MAVVHPIFLILLLHFSLQAADITLVISKGETLTLSAENEHATSTLWVKGGVKIAGTLSSIGRIEIFCPDGLEGSHEGVISCSQLTINTFGEGDSSAEIEFKGKIICPGGTVTLLSKFITLGNGAVIDTSGDEKGGDILIGGGFGGVDSSLPAADYVLIHPNVSLLANAKKGGPGGNVSVWSTLATAFYGTLSSEGPQRGGDAEISTKGVLYFDGKVSLNSPVQTGHLVLDPASITIQSESSQLTSSANDSVITPGALNTILMNGTPVTLSATDCITINSPITISGHAAALTLNAPTANLNGPITLLDGATLSGTATIVNIGPLGLIQNGQDVALKGK